MTASAGTLVAGKYRLRRLVGEGGMGAVYEAEHVELGKRVAVKTITAAKAGRADVVARFMREARAASAVQSDGIVDVYDVGTDPAVGVFMVMEFLDGEDLATRLEREKKIAPVVAAEIGLQCARALGRAHAAGVVHRDLKPANVFLVRRDDGQLRAKIVDFGISKIVDEALAEAMAAGEALTRGGELLGTPYYMSPEQARGGAATVDARTDVWALGAVLYEMLAGRPAYDAVAHEALLVKIITESPPMLREVAPEVPEPLAAVVRAAMEHDLARRIPDGGALAQRLGQVLVELTGRAPDQSGQAAGVSADLAFAATAAVAPIAVAPPPAGPGYTLRMANAPMPRFSPIASTLGPGKSMPAVPQTPLQVRAPEPAPVAPAMTTLRSSPSPAIDRRLAAVIVAALGTIFGVLVVLVVVVVLHRTRARADATAASASVAPAVTIDATTPLASADAVDAVDAATPSASTGASASASASASTITPTAATATAAKSGRPATSSSPSSAIPASSAPHQVGGAGINLTAPP